MKFHTSLLDILNSKTKLKIVNFLLTHEAQMSEREIASVVRVSHMSVNRTMRELADINLVDFVSIGKAHLWRVNRRSYAFKVFSRLIRGMSSVQDPLESLKETILKGLPKKLIKRVVLFGSVAKGSERINSDIDLFVLVKDSRSKEEIESSIDRLSNICLETYGNRLAPYILTEREMREKKSLNIISEVKKGVQVFP